MSRKSKWIEAESLHEPAPDVARRAIQARLETVWHWLPPAADEAGDDIEYVHQLRVSTRRATAALHLFEAMLPRKRSRWFRKQLKRIRKASGEARDLDVLGQRITDACQADAAPGCATLLERVTAERRAAQPEISEIRLNLSELGFRRRVKRLADRIRWRTDDAPTPSYQAAAQAGLQPLAATFFSAAEADLDNTPALHEFRIAGKQLRYAMEVFAAAFEPSFRKDLYPIVEELQGKLGSINDHANHRDRYLAWLDDTADESQRLLLGKLIASETAALQSCTREFRQWWTPECAANFKARFWQEISSSELRCA